jgi:hypothetical protein
MRKGDAPYVIFIDEVKGKLTIIDTVINDDIKTIVSVAQAHPNAVMYRR